MFFVARDGINGKALWRSDGTSTGTALVRDFAPEGGYSYLDDLTAVGSTLFFTADFGSLYKSDGTPAGTVVVRDNGPSTGPSGAEPTWPPRAPAAVHAAEGRHRRRAVEVGRHRRRNLPGQGHQAWYRRERAEQPHHDGWHGLLRRLRRRHGDRSCGSPTAPRPARSWSRTSGTGAGSSYLRHLTVVGSTLFFVADDGTSTGPALWKSDGTTAGTVLVKDVDTAPVNDYNYYSGPNQLTAAGGKLYFVAEDGTTGRELWTSDGTTGGTVLVEDIRTNGTGYYSGYNHGSNPTRLTAVGTRLYFTADDGTSGRELWVSDGSAAGTSLVRDVRPGGAGSDIYEVAAVGGTVYFTADDGVTGRELWRSDGTAAGTTLVRDIRPGASTSLPTGLAAMGGVLYFTADDGATGRELWRSDGTAGGTTLVRDLHPGAPSSSLGYAPLVVGSTLYFSADDGVSGTELWKSDGTSGGTSLVRDIVPGADGSYPSYYPVAAGGLVYFTAFDGAGEELWRTDGTAPGTFRVSGATGDTTAPDTTISSGPAAGSTITTSSATFAFSGTAGDTAVLQCSLDGGAFFTCTSPYTFSGLGNGSHTVRVRAIDAAGNADPVPAERTFTVSVPGPTPTPTPDPDAHAHPGPDAHPVPTPTPAPTPAPVPTPAASNVFTAPSKASANTKKGTLDPQGDPAGSRRPRAAPGRQGAGQVRQGHRDRGRDRQDHHQADQGRLALLRKAKTGTLAVKVTLTYTPTGGTPRAVTKKYKLILK